MNLLKIITPINIDQEKAKFFKDTKYSPVFKYNWDKLKPIVSNSLKSKLVTAIISQDIQEILRLASDYFQVKSFEELKNAHDIVKNKPTRLSQESISDFVVQFTNVLDYFDLSKYKVEVVDLSGFNFRPSTKDKKIYMSKYANFQFFSAEGEVRHELVHIIRYENGKHNNIKKSKDYLPTEEGLATLMQDTSINGSSSQFQHAAEYVASSIGLNGSLNDIFEYFLSIGFDKELAWQRSIRHKFGFIETKVNGDILKPAMYFANSQKIRKLNKNEQLKLFIGKIPINDLSKYPQYVGVIDKDKLKHFYNL